MGGNDEKGMYNQLMEVMARLDSVDRHPLTRKAENRPTPTMPFVRRA